jgi:hypothetical protein
VIRREICSSRERKVKILLVFPKYLRIFLTPSLSQLREKSSCSVFTKCGVPCNLDKLLSLFEAWINIVISITDVSYQFLSCSIWAQTKDYKIGICCFSAKHAGLRRKSKGWLVRNQNNVSEWGDRSIHRLLFQWANTIKIQLSMLV